MDYKTTVSTSGMPWTPHEQFAIGTSLISNNQIRIITWTATTTGETGGGTNPDGTYWGYPFTLWLLDRAQVASTILDGTVMWKCTSVAPFNPPPPQGNSFKRLANGNFTEEPANNFFQPDWVGGTPTNFLNWIDPKPFAPLILERWDLFEEKWSQKGWQWPLYAVEIVFNAQIRICGRGSIPPGVGGMIPFFTTFEGEGIPELTKKVGRIADSVGLFPISTKRPMPMRPNLVFIISPFFPDPARPGEQVERGGRFSNL
jgi:hypothetical protein